jgi:hypothetical protein
MATTLVAGDIAFTAFQSDNTNTALGGAGGDMFEFVLLKDVEKGTTIYFTDCGFRVNPNNLQYASKFNTTEGLIRWTAQSELSANTKISLAASGTTPPTTTAEWTGISTTDGTVLTAINLQLGTGGDSVTAIIGPINFGEDGFSGTAIASIYWGDASYTSTFTALSGGGLSGLPTGLEVGKTAVAVGSTDNGRYNQDATGSVETGAVSDVRTSINTKANWTTSKDTLSGDGRTTATFTALCYLAGTHIHTPSGERRIETLAIGDEITTIDGTQRLRWIGRHSYPRAVAGPWVSPIRISTDAFGQGLPHRDLLVSPWHAILLGDVLVRAADLVNGSTITQIFPGMVAHYLNLEFDAPTVVYAEGVAAETYANHANRHMFENAAEYTALYGDDARVMIDAAGHNLRRFPIVFDGPRFQDALRRANAHRRYA